MSAFGNDPGSPQERITYFTTAAAEAPAGDPRKPGDPDRLHTTRGLPDGDGRLDHGAPAGEVRHGATVYDIRSLGAHAALKAAGFTNNAALVGNGLEPAAKALVDANDPIMVGTVDPGEQNGGKFSIPLALDILAGKPFPTATFIPVCVYCGKRCGK